MASSCVHTESHLVQPPPSPSPCLINSILHDHAGCSSNAPVRRQAIQLAKHSQAIQLVVKTSSLLSLVTVFFFYLTVHLSHTIARSLFIQGHVIAHCRYPAQRHTCHLLSLPCHPIKESSDT